MIFTTKQNVKYYKKDWSIGLPVCNKALKVKTEVKR